MSLTNGFDEARILPVLTQRKGWRQPATAGSPVLDAANLACKSGKYFQDHHPAVSIDTVKNTQADKEITDVQFNALLTALNKSVCMEVLAAVFCKPMVADHPRMTVVKDAHAQLVPNTGTGKFAGLRLRVADGDFAAQLHNLVLLFDGAATFNIYLFHELVKAPLWSKQVTTVANTQTIVAQDEKILCAADTATRGGTFYLGYFQEDLPAGVHALEYSSACRHSYGLVGAEGIEAIADHAATDFDRNAPACTTLNYGLAAEISTYHDYTNAIISRAADFDELIGNMMARRIIEQTMYTTRSNATQRMAQENNQMLYTDLNQDAPADASPYTPGIKAAIRAEIKRLQETWYPKTPIIIATPC